MAIYPEDNGQGLQSSINFLTDLFNRRGKMKASGNTIRIIEYNGGQIIEPTAFEPDPLSHRQEYYYNAITNILYKKITHADKGVVVSAYWRKVSE
jgi:hypothetical protein